MARRGPLPSGGRREEQLKLKLEGLVVVVVVPPTRDEGRCRDALSPTLEKRACGGVGAAHSG